MPERDTDRGETVCVLHVGGAGIAFLFVRSAAGLLAAFLAGLAFWLGEQLGCRTFRATGLTAYLQSSGLLCDAAGSERASLAKELLAGRATACVLLAARS